MGKLTIPKLHDRTGRLEIVAINMRLVSILHDRTGRLENCDTTPSDGRWLHDRTGRLEKAVRFKCR